MDGNELLLKTYKSVIKQVLNIDIEPKQCDFPDSEDIFVFDIPYSSVLNTSVKNRLNISDIIHTKVFEKCRDNKHDISVALDWVKE